MITPQNSVLIPARSSSGMPSKSS